MAWACCGSAVRLKNAADIWDRPALCTQAKIKVRIEFPSGLQDRVGLPWNCASAWLFSFEWDESFVRIIALRRLRVVLIETDRRSFDFAPPQRASSPGPRRSAQDDTFVMRMNDSPH